MVYIDCLCYDQTSVLGEKGLGRFSPPCLAPIPFRPQTLRDYYERERDFSKVHSFLNVVNKYIFTWCNVSKMLCKGRFNTPALNGRFYSKNARAKISQEPCSVILLHGAIFFNIFISFLFSTYNMSCQSAR